MTFGGSFGGERNMYLNQGKELQDELGGLNTYDFHARMYDPAIGRTFQLDPHADNYFGLSPYSWTANNPILMIDPDGRDYVMYFDHENQTITIRATYYAQSDDVESAQDAIDEWNKLSGNFAYKLGKKENAVEYTINFDLRVEEVEVDPFFGPVGSVNQAFSKDVSGGANVYRVVPDSDPSLKPNDNGNTIMNFIRVKDSQRYSTTGFHEVGHSLGLTHSSSGIMTPSSTDPNRSNNVTERDVKRMIKAPLRGKVNREDGADAGRGTFKNGTPIVNSSNDLEIYQRTYGAPKNLKKGNVRGL